MKKYTILISAVAAIGGLLFGFDTAVIAGTIPALRSYFTLDDNAIGLVVAAASIGCIPGALFAGNLANRYGRKLMMLVTAVLYVIAALGSGMAGSFESLVLYRFIGGLAIGMASTLAPIYISEVAPAQYRGRLGMSQQLAIVVGILLAFISNYFIDSAGWTFLTPENTWRYMLAAAVIPSVVFFILLLLVPESPRWLIQRERHDHAHRIFGRIYDAPKAKEELETVRQDIASSKQGLRFMEIFLLNTEK
ncbi:sugar porter family MFS transporter [Arachidicoccus ginsenosidivorans]|uniref:Sugar porter family MFS transporter n=1 Tax=Arachidicoccus ginsenosidivorans TaxID=496057 RepID=A0A5B8VG81_9BACT|nr:MFS transporter [Arachidicoccus ginsenosidivorans]QEC70480.1 sugar porter family MFS transporter [Arachidicoccus ginsenosidivorans]